MTKELVTNFAENWLNQQAKKPTKGERKLIMQFATIMDKLLEVSANEGSTDK